MNNAIVRFVYTTSNVMFSLLTRQAFTVIETMLTFSDHAGRRNAALAFVTCFRVTVAFNKSLFLDLILLSTR